MEYTFNVPSMVCQHCKMRIEQALRQDQMTTEVVVDLENKKVRVVSGAPAEQLIARIVSAGYEVVGQE